MLVDVVSYVTYLVYPSWRHVFDAIQAIELCRVTEMTYKGILQLSQLFFTREEMF